MREDKVHQCWLTSQDMAGHCMWDLAWSPCRVQPPSLCNVGEMYQDLSMGVFLSCPGSGPSGISGQWSRRGRTSAEQSQSRGHVAISRPLGSRSPSSPALRDPFLLLTPCLMPCLHPNAILTSLTRTRAHSVTMSVSGHWGAVRSHPGSQQISAFPGGGKGRQESQTLEHPPVSPCPLGPAHPHPCPPAMPASGTPGVKGLGPTTGGT